MHLAIHFLLNGESLLKNAGSFIQLSLRDQCASKHGQGRGGCGMILAVEGLSDIKTLPVETLGFAEAASFILDGAEINQIVRYMGMTLAVKLAVHGEDSL